MSSPCCLAAAIPPALSSAIVWLWLPFSLCLTPVFAGLLRGILRAVPGLRTSASATSWQQTAWLRTLLEGAAWVAALLVFGAIASLSPAARDLRFLLLPFALSLAVLRGCAWWLVGGPGVTWRGLGRGAGNGMHLGDRPLVVWTILGLAMNLVADTALFVGGGLHADLFAW